MNIHERVLSVLGCRYVNDVLIDAPYVITPEMIASLSISEVVYCLSNNERTKCAEDHDARYRHAKEAGILHVMESPCNFNMAHIVQRIHLNQTAFQSKFESKMKAETKFYDEKYKMT